MIIYPPKDHITESSTIFFIGSARESCVINGESIELVHAGNFCPVFKLKEGKNIFKIELDGDVFKWVITRNVISNQSEATVRDPVDQLKQVHWISRSARNDTTLKRICLDPGHGGEAYGTCSPKGLLEKNLNLGIALKLKEELIKKGYEVKLTREEDEDLSLQDRVDICREFNSDLFISVHHNAIPDHLNPLEHKGLSVHYFYEEYKKAAEEFSKELSQGLELKDNGAIQQNLHVLRENDFCPALLIEFGFLIHPVESELISTSAYQARVSELLSEKIGFLSQFLHKNM